METKEKMPFLKKIQNVRVELINLHLEKTGYNNYSKYKYWELGDFLPYVTQLCDKFGVFTDFQINIDNEIASLTLINIDNLEETRTWTTKIKKMELKGCNEMQNIQGTHTSAKKILYLMAFEIAESDLGEITKQEQEANDEANQLISLDDIEKINKLINSTGTDREKFYSYFKIKEVGELQYKNYHKAIQLLTKKKEEQNFNNNEANKTKELPFGGMNHEPIND